MSTSLRGILERALDDHGLSVRLDRRLPGQVWDEAVGAEIAKRARPTVLSGGVLHLLVLDHRWRDQLDAMRGPIIAQVNARLGRPLVRELRFGLAHAGALDPRAGATGPQRPAPPLGAGAGALVPAADKLPPELREALLGAAAAAEARAQRLGADGVARV